MKSELEVLPRHLLDMNMTFYLNAWTRYQLIISMNLVREGSSNSSKKVAWLLPRSS